MANKAKFDFPNDPDEQLDHLHRMLTEGQRWRDAWGKGWDKAAGILRGALWPDKITRPMFQANLISTTVRRGAGLLVDAKPGLDVRARRTGLGDAAEVLKRTITAILDEQNQSMVFETLAYFLAAFGCGFWKISFDPKADFGAGDIVLLPVDPRLMLVDNTVRYATDLWKAQYLVEESIVPYSWVQQMFPRTSKDVEPEASMPYETNETHKISWYQRLIDKIRKQSGVLINEESAVPRVFIRQFWVADNSIDEDGLRIYPGGRRIWVTGDDKILNPSSNPKDLDYGQANPFWDGLWPYVMLDNQPDLDHPFGQSEVEPIKKLNDSFNSIGNVTTKTLIKNLAAIVADAGAIDVTTLQELKDREEMVIEHTPGRKVDRQPPLQPSTINVQAMQFILTLIEMQAGLNDGALQGKGRVELRSAPQLEGLQQVAQVLIRAKARRLENAIERGGQLLISRIFQYYTSDRIMTYIDNGLMKSYEYQVQQLQSEVVKLATKEAEEAANKEFNDKLKAGMSVKEALVEPKPLTPEEIEQATRGAWKLFRFKVIPFSTLASTKIQRAMLLENLAQQLLIPASLVVKEAGFDNPEELQTKALEEAQKRQQMGFPPPGPPAKGGGKKK